MVFNIQIITVMIGITHWHYTKPTTVSSLKRYGIKRINSNFLIKKNKENKSLFFVDANWSVNYYYNYKTRFGPFQGARASVPVERFDHVLWGYIYACTYYEANEEFNYNNGSDQFEFKTS